MFDTLVLLTGSAEQSLLAPVLRGRKPELRIVPVVTADQLHAGSVADLHRARLVAFVSDVIVPAHILSSARYGAFNFHPGSPEYPGWAPAHFALYERAERFGATFHAMAERVDTGPIFDVDDFRVAPNTTVLELEEMTYAYLARMFWRWAEVLANQAENLTPRTTMRWRDKKNSRRAYESLCNIPLDISKEDLARRMSVFGHNHYGIMPSINLHGFEFRAAALPH
jgi:methionyl-tRNA formyltransferase